MPDLCDAEQPAKCALRFVQMQLSAEPGGALEDVSRLSLGAAERPREAPFAVQGLNTFARDRHTYS